MMFSLYLMVAVLMCRGLMLEAFTPHFSLQTTDNNKDRLDQLEKKQANIDAMVQTLEMQQQEQAYLVDSVKSIENEMHNLKQELIVMQAERQDDASVGNSVKAIEKEIKNFKEQLEQIESKTQNDASLKKTVDNMQKQMQNLRQRMETQTQNKLEKIPTQRQHKQEKRPTQTQHKLEKRPTQTKEDDSLSNAIESMAKTVEDNQLQMKDLGGGGITSCPVSKGYVSLSDTLCIRHSGDDRKKWADSDAVCKREGGQLLTFYNKEEQELVLKYFKDQGMKASKIRSWVGLQRRKDATWEWTSGSSLEPIWAPIFPMDLDIYQCAGLSYFGLTDGLCGGSRRYVCRYTK